MNRLRDLARRRGAEARAVERITETAPIDAIGIVGERDALRRALHALSEEERVVVALRFGGDLSLREIADLLEERQSTIEGRLYRALRRLRNAAR